MHAFTFYCVFSIPYPTTSFLSCSITLNLFSSSSLRGLPFSTQGYLSPFYTVSFHGISPFCPQGFTNRFWFIVGIPPGLPTNPLVARPLPLLKVCLLHHSSFQDKTPCFVSPFPLFVLPEWIKIGGFLFTYPYGMHRVVTVFCLSLFGRNAIPARPFSKRSLGRNLKISPFLPTTKRSKPHPLNPLTVDPPSLYWLGTGW